MIFKGEHLEEARSEATRFEVPKINKKKYATQQLMKEVYNKTCPRKFFAR